MKTVVFIIILLFSFATLAEETLNPAARLKRLSRIIRGIDPSSEDYTELQKILSGQMKSDDLSNFFRVKTSSYLESSNHVDHLENRLLELFRLRRPGIVQSGSIETSAINHLFRSLAQKNESWDNLLISKKIRFDYYPSVNPGPFASTGEVGFYEPVLPELGKKASSKKEFYNPSSPPNSVPMLATAEFNIAPGDVRFAGALTTRRFISRHTTTTINKNRRRAAAVLRIFLCKDLKPIIIESPNQNKVFLGRAFPDEIDKPTTVRVMQDPHGNQMDCKQCHLMLDPIGRTFQSIGVTMGLEPHAGALAFVDDDGQEINVPVNGIGELAQKVVEHPSYSQCQVNHFWRWYIGKDVFLSQARRKELVAEFDRLGRKTNDFITYLVNQPEFYTKPKNEISMTGAEIFNLVRPVFNRCMDCHKNGAAPDLFPSDVPAENMKPYIADVIRVLDLRNDGAKAMMPPAKANWKLSLEEIENLKKWVRAGSPNNQGKNQLDEASVKELLP